MEKAAQDPDRKVTFVDLGKPLNKDRTKKPEINNDIPISVPGRLYNITLWTVSGGQVSKPLERQDRLHPERVSNLNATRITDNEITLEWQRPFGDIHHYDVVYLDPRGRKIPPISPNRVTKDPFLSFLVSGRLIANTSDTNSITIGRLRPFRNYTFSISTVSGTPTTIQKKSSQISASFRTKESVPGSLTAFEPFEVQPSKITFTWDLPKIGKNGGSIVYLVPCLLFVKSFSLQRPMVSSRVSSLSTSKLTTMTVLHNLLTSLPVTGMALSRI